MTKHKATVPCRSIARFVGYCVFLSVCGLLAVRDIEAVPIQWSGNSHLYEVVASSGSWAMADAGARSRGGYLATITSAAENEFVFGLIARPEFWDVPTGTYGPWIGGLQLPGSAEPVGGWQWVSGEPWTYSNWYMGEANNLDGIEDHLHFSQHQAVWNDLPWYVTTPAAYVVEYDLPGTPASVVPEPTTLTLLATGLPLFGYFVRGRRTR